MIKLVRIDHRLLHGQVAFSWTNGVGADCILVASDMVVNDDVWKTTLKLGKPSGCKLVIKNMQDSIDAINSGVTDKYKLVIVVQTIEEAKQLVDGCPQIKSINLGNTKESEETKQLSKQIFVTKKEEEILKEFVQKGLEVEIRALVDDKKIFVEKVL
ncbi:fructoselysine and glucoselysine-specific PTS system IIB component [Breznakia sp. PF5-3]|uniref:PTS sugar transporter subunit IIB n=1 Tax=unclassified Breznakia TaxID=2623764 RepID=UPI002405B3FA|nr:MULTISPECIES: PTS sugar transporter subunit IIB [unclassified Breznakia]MDL2276240.1 PTS sugar transporter subunit IIB [Breznakia sp. OttesenSCG-928-G09]MDF9824898.1 fructoselysine and glucoselysine-specific PTS system IIB component [Breznakia sp. PM6-1]MDF9835603.1 fructoselysine and glucoselysine-specific PTS system IIB component [Breznakia sp. PF5-3]MDF9837981.1 fructoselysine and glucoselysine-specific PTS system IIB component [Breznakia sp. PFB2-8]MDF9859970.1 fructoselysine and glucos